MSADVLVALFRLPHPGDPAIDTSRCDVAAYTNDRDPTKLVYLPDRRPDMFVLRPIKSAHLSCVLDAVPDHLFKEKLRQTFLASCHSVELGTGPSQSVLKPAKITVNQYRQDVADDDWFDQLRARYGLNALIFIASVAYARTHLPDDLSPTSPSSAG